MADKKKAVLDNVDGEFFVDTTCINCDTCRQLAGATFRDQGEYSFVYQQPGSQQQREAATRALLCCPTGSIGTSGTNLAKSVMPDLPMSLAANVYYCGFNSEKSYGANSYFITHPDGNWLVDSPKYLPHLIKQFEDLGGIRYIFLTHQDDVADCDRYAAKFNAKRIIHKADASAAPGSEIVLDGCDDVAFAPDFLIIPVPGHTRGHMVLLYKNFLFTGDHLAYDRDTQKLEAFRNHCWYSWSEQIESMKKLLSHRFDWVLAGHGDRVQLDAEIMHERLLELIEWMKQHA